MLWTPLSIPMIPEKRLPWKIEFFFWIGRPVFFLFFESFLNFKGKPRKLSKYLFLQSAFFGSQKFSRIMYSRYFPGHRSSKFFGSSRYLENSPYFHFSDIFSCTVMFKGLKTIELFFQNANDPDHFNSSFCKIYPAVPTWVAPFFSLVFKGFFQRVI